MRKWEVGRIIWRQVKKSKRVFVLLTLSPRFFLVKGHLIQTYGVPYNFGRDTRDTRDMYLMNPLERSKMDLANEGIILCVFIFKHSSWYWSLVGSKSTTHWKYSISFFFFFLLNIDANLPCQTFLIF